MLYAIGQTTTREKKDALADGTASQSCSDEQRIQSREAQEGRGTEREVDEPPVDDIGCTGVRSARSDYRFGTT